MFFVRCLYKALIDTINHDGVEHAGYLAFLSILSLFPFLVFFFSLVGFVGQTDIGVQFITLILDSHFLPKNVISALQPRMAEIISGPPQGLLTFSIIGAVWTASSAVEGLRTTLNRAYRVEFPPPYILRRMLSIAEFLFGTGMILTATIILVIIPNIWLNTKGISSFEYMFVKDGISPSILHFGRYAIIAFILFTIVSMLYYALPNIKQSIKFVMPGAVIVVILWFFSGHLLTKYLQDFHQVSIIYGSLGGFIATLVFFYVSAVIFIFGAEFNYSLWNYIEKKSEIK